ncbi:MBL fold metallo-hydrolase RNA specificity domain-containing protein, partial [Streptobacillus moniliformis]
INQLLKKEASVIFEKVMGIHVSGHGCQEEQKLMINLIKPKYFMPVHGEYVMLKKHKELAMEVGMPEENIILAENGFK